jgi:hypothetical protein
LADSSESEIKTKGTRKHEIRIVHLGAQPALESFCDGVIEAVGESHALQSGYSLTGSFPLPEEFDGMDLKGKALALVSEISGAEGHRYV